MKKILLTKGCEAIVDDGDYEYLNQWKWHAYLSPNGKNHYAKRTHQLRGKKSGFLMHRAILTPPGELQVDHINMDTLDNRRSNLRLATSSQNHCNTKGRGKSGAKGVYESGLRWMAQIRTNKKKIYLGTFSDVRSAALAYDEAAKKYHGEFARLNFPQA